MDQGDWSEREGGGVGRTLTMERHPSGSVSPVVSRP